MTSTASNVSQITGDVDTHRDTHHAAVIDQVGRRLADAEFLATAAVLRWLNQHGAVRQVGVEGTGAYGAGLARQITVTPKPGSTVW